MSTWIVIPCCIAREDAVSDDFRTACTAQPAPASVEDLIFHDCAETEAELEALQVLTKRLPGSMRPPPPRPAPQEAGYDQFARDCTDLHVAQAVLKNARDEWFEQVRKLRKEAELELETEWANLAAARRMLKANIGDARKAVRMLVQALELRAEHAQLFRTMRCEARCDMRIVGRDLHGHPMIYMCARSQTEGLGGVLEQILVTFEAACRLAGDLGTVAFVLDMHGLRPHLNMDPKAIKAAADALGTVYAARICRIMVVDFSRAAQAIWWMVRPLLAPATREKFAFLNEAQARQELRGHLDDGLHERLCQTFAINRDPGSTEAARSQHARATTFGTPLS